MWRNCKPLGNARTVKKSKSRAINERQNGTLKGGIYFNNGTTINRTFSAFVRHQTKSNNISDITITTYESTCAKKQKSLDEIKRWDTKRQNKTESSGQRINVNKTKRYEAACCMSSIIQ